MPPARIRREQNGIISRANCSWRRTVYHGIVFLKESDHMDGLTIALTVLACICGILAPAFAVRYLKMKTELKSFREQISEIRTTDREQPIKVASFGAPTVALAKEINLLVAELRTAAHRSAEEEQRVRTIMAGVSHDFRTPLTAADGYLQMVKEAVDGILAEDSTQNEKPATDEMSTVKGSTQNEKPATDEMSTAEDTYGEMAVRRQELTEIRDYLCIVSERMRYLKTLSDEFFEVTYLDAKKSLPLETVRFDILLSEVMMGQYAWIEASGIEPKLSIPEEQLTVQADRHYLERILDNLFSNARKYAKSRIELSAAKSHDGRICFILRNDMKEGITIDVDHIFEPFYRAKARSGPGTGLGLYVVKELADAMAFQIEGQAEGEMFEIRLTMPGGDI